MIVQAAVNSITAPMGRYTVNVIFGESGLHIYIDLPEGDTANSLMLDLADVGGLRLLVREFTDDGVAVRELPLYAAEEV